MAVITLTTDFGTSDSYVGAVKGVLLKRTATKQPYVEIIDIAHDIPRGDIAHAAWVVATATREYPDDSIHIVVVDPGVGGKRPGVVVHANGSYYVGPDNGVFAYLDNVRWVRAIENKSLMASRVSPTFHGRDVFAPIAALLACGVEITTIGQRVELTGELPWGPRPKGEGRVVHIDRFGNLITDLPAAEATDAVVVDGQWIMVARTYEDVDPGELVAYAGSANTIEIAIRDGRAEDGIEAPRGTRVQTVVTGGQF
jgi:S-adenosylmethionine hydrolase